ncbi:MAG TPA: PAS domain-containing protein [Microvirga sp.]|jgi:PAS domain S-box-containing protein|nr:PAS domain-containing protein [Microvirga sp.]
MTQALMQPSESTPAWSEAERLAALRDFGILDTAPEAAFDDIARIAAHVCGAPIAVVNFIEDERQWFKAEIGLGVRETPLDVSICAHAILQPGLFVVPDTTKDRRFQNNPLVTGEPGLRFYAGALLETQDGLPLGTLCVLDTQVRPEGITEAQGQTLLALARQVMTQLEHRRALARLARRESELAESERRFRTIADAMPQIVWSALPNGYHDYFNRRWYEFTGATAEECEGTGWNPTLHPDDREKAWSAWQVSLATGQPYEIEYRFRAQDGSYRWFIGRALPIRNEAGAVERWFGTCTDVDDLKRSEEARELLARELSHRIKNIFAVVGGLAALSVRGHEEARPFAESFRQRLNALARANDYARPHAETEIEGRQSVHGLIRVLLTPYLQAGRERLILSGDDVPIGEKSAASLALILHEQATNAVKYGALSTEAGRVIVTGERAGEGYTLTWKEEGGPLIAGPPIRQGFGTLMAARSASGQLGGALTHDWAPEGLIMRLTVPAARLVV